MTHSRDASTRRAAGPDAIAVSPAASVIEQVEFVLPMPVRATLVPLPTLVVAHHASTDTPSRPPARNQPRAVLQR